PAVSSQRNPTRVKKTPEQFPPLRPVGFTVEAVLSRSGGQKMANTPTRERQTLNTIEAALKLIDAKKDKLKEAYDELRLHSSILTCSLSWEDLDSHFSSQQADLNRRFHLLQSREKAPSSSNKQNGVVTNSNQASSSQPAGDDSDGGFEYEHDDAGLGEEEDPMVLQEVAARPELTLLCEKLDGKGLRDYISDHAKERVAIRAELTSAMQASSDPASMVLDAMEGFYPANSSPSNDQQELYRQRKSCLDLLEVLVNIKPNVSDELRERAKQMALEWKGKVSLAADNPSEALAFLNVVAAFGLPDQIDVADLVTYFVAIAKFKQAMSLCRNIGLGENIAVLVEKLIESGKQLLAVKFIYEFGLTDKFEAVPLLKEFVNECKKSTNQACKDGKSPIKAQHEAKSKELAALKSVLQVIDEHKLESEYPRKEIEKRIETLQMQKTDGKRATPSSETKPQQPKKKKQMLVKKQPQGKKPQHQQHNGNNRFRTPPHMVGSSIPPYHHQPHLQPTGVYQAAGPYAPPTGGPYAGSYGAGGPYGSGGFPNRPHVAQQYASESQMVPGYYDGGQAPGYHGGYGYPPQHHQNYYPQ
ncbi:FRIGIDA-like protein 1, partial [Linum grandiflorum]